MRSRNLVTACLAFVCVCLVVSAVHSEEKSSGKYAGSRSVLVNVTTCAAKGKALNLFNTRAVVEAGKWSEAAAQAKAVGGVYRFVWDAEAVRLVQEMAPPDGKSGERCIHGVAEVSYGLEPEDGTGDPARLAAPGAPLMVGLATDKGAYDADETIQVGFKGNKDFYGRLFFVSATKAMIQLVPKAGEPAPLFKAGVQYDFPSADDSVELKVSKPYGKGAMVLFASTAPLADIPLKAAEGGLGVFTGSFEELEAAARKLADPATGTPCEFFEAVWRFSTGPALPIKSRGKRRMPLKPIDMTGAAGRSGQPGTEGLK